MSGVDLRVGPRLAFTPNWSALDAFALLAVCGTLGDVVHRPRLWVAELCAVAWLAGSTAALHAQTAAGVSQPGFHVVVVKKAGVSLEYPTPGYRLT